jgi:hypothetical protein
MAQNLLHQKRDVCNTFYDITWTVKIWSKYEDTAFPGIFAVIGGLRELKEEVIFIMNEASFRYNVSSILNSVHLHIGTYVIVSEVCFKNGICCAVKMYESRLASTLDQAINDGTSAANLVRPYCPDIPINTPRGCGMHKLRYRFMDWVEGELSFIDIFRR